MKPIFQLSVFVFLGLFLSACGDSDGKKVEATAGSSSEVARFGDELGKGCDLLTAEMVSSTFGVPVDGLKQMKVMGCLYSWDNDVDELDASIMMIRTHESESAAETWFGNATRSRTAEEMQEEMKQVSERMDSREELDTDAKKSVAKGFLKSIGNKAVIFEDVADVGDEARVNADGNVYVRVDNLTFMVSAYYGPEAPPADIQGIRDIKQMMAAALENTEEWKAKTLPQRKRDAAKLARTIVAAL